MVAMVSVPTGYLALRQSGQEEAGFGGIACSEVREQLPQYVAGELDDRLSDRIRRHLEHCPACQSEKEEMSPPTEQVSRNANDQNGVPSFTSSPLGWAGKTDPTLPLNQVARH